MKLNRSLFVAFSFLLICAVFSPLGVAKASASSLSASEVVREINNERSARGLSLLRLDSALSTSADKRSTLLVSLGDLIHLSSLPGTSWPEFVEAGYINTYAGENLALGLETPEDLVRQWMNSPAHRANILGTDYTDIGIGVTTGTYKGASHPVSYVVAFFSSARTAPPSVQTVPPPVPTVVRSTPSKPVSQPKVVETKTTEATSVAPAVPVVLGALAEPTPQVSSSVEEEISILKRLIALLESYLAIFLASPRA